MRLVSADRKALGKSSLAIDPSLVAIARNAPFTCPTKSSLTITGRARDMAVRAYFSHDIKGCRKSDGTAYRAREILAVLYGYTGSRSEIIHWNSAGTADTTYKVGCDSNGSNCKGGTITVSKTVATAQRNFMSSSTHRAVELSTTYDRFGCGSAKAPDSARVYYACLFTAGGPTVLAKPTPTPTPTPDPEADQRVLQREPADQGDDERHPQGDDRPRNDGPGHRHRHRRRQLQHRVRRQGRLRQELVQDRPGQRQIRFVALWRERRVRGRGPVPSGLHDDRGTAAGEHRDGRPDGRRQRRGDRRRNANTDARSLPHPDTHAVPKSDAQPDPDPSPTPSPTPNPSPTPSPSPTPLIAKVYTLTSSVTFYGRGYGHGVGLSQYGARGRAAAGQGYAAILAHYFQGTTLGTVANSQIRVLVLNDFAASSTHPLTIYGRTGTFTIDGISKTFPKDARVRIYPTTSSGTTWKVVVTSAGGTTLHNGSIAKSFRIRPAQTSTRLQNYSKPSSYDRYRGVLRIVASTKVDVINELPLESYLRGVVPAEMPSNWHAEALKAQTVAARSFAARRLRPGVSTFDLYDDTRSQVYQGVLREATSTNSCHHGNGRQGRQERLVDREHVLPLDRGRRDGEQRERLRVVLRGEGGGPRELPPRLVRPGTRRQALRRVIAVHLVEDRDVHALPALVMAGRRQPHERGQRREARSPQPRRLGAADQRDDHRLDRHEEDGLRGRVPVGDQCQAAIRRPAVPRQLLRADAGPLSPPQPSPCVTCTNGSACAT